MEEMLTVVEMELIVESILELMVRHNIEKYVSRFSWTHLWSFSDSGEDGSCAVFCIVLPYS